MGMAESPKAGAPERSGDGGSAEVEAKVLELLGDAEGARILRERGRRSERVRVEAELPAELLRALYRWSALHPVELPISRAIEEDLKALYAMMGYAEADLQHAFTEDEMRCWLALVQRWDPREWLVSPRVDLADHGMEILEHEGLLEQYLGVDPQVHQAFTGKLHRMSDAEVLVMVRYTRQALRHGGSLDDALRVLCGLLAPAPKKSSDASAAPPSEDDPF